MTAPAAPNPADIPAPAPAGRIWRFGDNVDTDAMAPAVLMKSPLPVLARHCLASLRPEFPGSVRPGDVVVAGANFGIGSSREQAPQDPGDGGGAGPDRADDSNDQVPTLGLTRQVECLDAGGPAACPGPCSCHSVSRSPGADRGQA